MSNQFVKKLQLGALFYCQNDDTDQKHQDGYLVDPVHYLDVEVGMRLRIGLLEAQGYQYFCKYLHGKVSDF